MLFGGKYKSRIQIGTNAKGEILVSEYVKGFFPKYYFGAAAKAVIKQYTDGNAKSSHNGYYI